MQSELHLHELAQYAEWEENEDKDIIFEEGEELQDARDQIAGQFANWHGYLL